MKPIRNGSDKCLRCERLDRAAARNANLIVRLSRMAAEFHDANHGSSLHWRDCQDPTCALNWQAIQEFNLIVWGKR